MRNAKSHASQEPGSWLRSSGRGAAEGVQGLLHLTLELLQQHEVRLSIALLELLVRIDLADCDARGIVASVLETEHRVQPSVGIDTMLRHADAPGLLRPPLWSPKMSDRKQSKDKHTVTPHSDSNDAKVNEWHKHNNELDNSSLKPVIKLDPEDRVTRTPDSLPVDSALDDGAQQLQNVGLGMGDHEKKNRQVECDSLLTPKHEYDEYIAKERTQAVQRAKTRESLVDGPNRIGGLSNQAPPHVNGQLNESSASVASADVCASQISFKTTPQIHEVPSDTRLGAGLPLGMALKASLLASRAHVQFRDKSIRYRTHVDDIGPEPTEGMETVDEDDVDSTYTEDSDLMGDGGNLVLVPRAAKLGRPSGFWIIHPNSAIRVVWDALWLIVFAIEMIHVPLDIGFDVGTHDWWFWGTTGFFALDLCSQFFTGFWMDGTLVMRQWEIVKHYICRYFIIDLIATVPWEFLFSLFVDEADSDPQNESVLLRIMRFGKLLRMLRMLRVIQLPRLLSRFEDILRSQTFSRVLFLLKTLTCFFILCHWAACLWGVIGDPVKIDHPTKNLPPYDLELCEPGGPCEGGIMGSPWTRRYAVENLLPRDRYLIALHSSIGLLTASDMGLSPGYWGERTYVVFMMVVSYLLSAVILSQIVVVVGQLQESKAELKGRIGRAKEFMASRKVPAALQAKVRRYLEYEHSVSTRGDGHDRVFMEKLSPWIRLELNEHMNRPIIIRHPFFCSLARPVRKRVCGTAVTVLYAPGDVVVQRGHKAMSMCYIVFGKLKILRQGGRAENKMTDEDPIVLSPPCWIGDMCLFKDVLRTNTVQSMLHSECLMIEKEKLLSLFEEFPKAQKFYDDYKRRVLEGDLAATGVRCWHCGEPGHYEDDCPKLKAAKESELEKRGLSGTGISGRIGSFKSKFLGMFGKRSLKRESQTKRLGKDPPHQKYAMRQRTAVAGEVNGLS